jgi:hypothetical protein
MVDLTLRNSVLLLYQALERGNRGSKRVSPVTLCILIEKKGIFLSRESVCFAAWIIVYGVLRLWHNLSGILGSSISLLYFRAASTVFGNCCSHHASQPQPATIATNVHSISIPPGSSHITLTISYEPSHQPASCETEISANLDFYTSQFRGRYGLTASIEKNFRPRSVAKYVHQRRKNRNRGRLHHSSWGRPDRTNIRRREHNSWASRTRNIVSFASSKRSKRYIVLQLSRTANIP